MNTDKKYKQQILKTSRVIDDLNDLADGVLERDLSKDQIANILLGMVELYNLRFETLFYLYEQSLKDKNKGNLE